MKMLVLVFVFFVILLISSIQGQKNLDFSSGEGFYTYNLQLIPTTFINTKDPPLCFDWIHYVIIDETLQVKKSPVKRSNQNKYSLIKNIENSNSTASTAKECPLEQLNELMNLSELGDNFWLLSTGCSQKQYVGVFKFDGDLIYETYYVEASKGDYESLFQNLSPQQRRINVTDMHLRKLRVCAEGCKNSLGDVTQHCYYKAPYDNTTEIYIFIGVAGAIFISAVLITVFYYNS